jgi:hypothetical protein
MKRILLYGLLALTSVTPCLAAETNLWDELLNVTVPHIKRDGPDSECADFISGEIERSWARRFEIVKLVTPYLEDKSPEKVAGALEVLYRVRGHNPHSGFGIGRLPGDFEAENAAFFADLDKQVYQHFDHFRELKRDRVYRALALYLGVSRTAQAKRELLEIAHSPFAAGAKEQALICLAWHRDRADMGTLLPFMLEDSAAAQSLPYHFRNSYGEAALPYLRKAVTEAKSEATRRKAGKELTLLEHK